MTSPRKRHALGQHFLRDTALCRKIAEDALTIVRESGCATLLEIGPGKGAITLPLFDGMMKEADSSPLRRLIISETDTAFIERWKEDCHYLVPHSVRAEVAEGDFLQLPVEKWLPSEGKLAVVSNLPYSAGTAIVTRLARHPERIPGMVLMFQAEVARRLRAQPGTKDWGSLSLWMQNRWDVSLLHFVPPKAFNPPPKVDSEVVLLVPRSQPRIEVRPEEEDRFEALLKVAFAHRRKMLRSGLPPQGPWRAALEAAGIDGTLRSEALTWDQWARWWEALPR
jgi:16S rRNA (adenine1518-N6/adenine1519-N6)-dimethyltransferase